MWFIIDVNKLQTFMYLFFSEAEGISNPTVRLIVVQFHTHSGFLMVAFWHLWDIHLHGCPSTIWGWHQGSQSSTVLRNHNLLNLSWPTYKEELGILESQCCPRKSLLWNVRPQVPEACARFWMALSSGESWQSKRGFCSSSCFAVPWSLQVQA